ANAPLVASSNRHRPNVRRRNPGHRHHRQPDAKKMLGLHDPFAGDPQRAWQRRANPVLIALLHLVLESRLHHLEAGRIDRTKPKGSGPNWELLAFKPELPQVQITRPCSFVRAVSIGAT